MNTYLSLASERFLDGSVGAAPPRKQTTPRWTDLMHQNSCKMSTIGRVEAIQVANITISTRPISIRRFHWEPLQSRRVSSPFGCFRTVSSKRLRVFGKIAFFVVSGRSAFQDAIFAPASTINLSLGIPHPTQASPHTTPTNTARKRIQKYHTPCYRTTKAPGKTSAPLFLR